MPRPETADEKLGSLRPIKVRRAVDEVVAVLADAIRGGLYGPGERLPTERDLAVQLGVSRTVVREALAQLKLAGVLAISRGPNGGSVVKSSVGLGQVLATLESETMGGIRALLEVRRPLELVAALRTARRATEADLQYLRSLVADLDGALDDPELFYEVDVRFHLTVGTLSGNALLAEMVRTLFNRLALLRESFPVGHVEIQQALANQRDTMAALESKSDRRITRSLDVHLGAFEEHFLAERLPFIPSSVRV
jgi:GntR family transcriptional repressor for pyruvate dehydrogenase complex